MTLVEFLLARIAEDEERIAHWDSDGRARVATMWTGGTPGYTTVASDHADELNQAQEALASLRDRSLELAREDEKAYQG